jgi:hypothetical protein
MKNVPPNLSPRWPLYRSLRRIVERELDPAGTFTPGSRSAEIAVDDYLRIHIGSITKDLKELFRRDLEAHEAHYADHVFNEVPRRLSRPTNAMSNDQETIT